MIRDKDLEVHHHHHCQHIGGNAKEGKVEEEGVMAEEEVVVVEEGDKVVMEVRIGGIGVDISMFLDSRYNN